VALYLVTLQLIRLNYNCLLLQYRLEDLTFLGSALFRTRQADTVRRLTHKVRTIINGRSGNINRVIDYT